MTRDGDRRRFLGELGVGLGGMLLTLRSPASAVERAAVRPVVLGREMLGTLIEGEAAHPDLRVAREALDAGFARIADVDRLMSIFRPDSEVSRLSRAAGAGAVAVSEDTYRVLREARALGIQTGGSLDVTMLPLRRLWTLAAERGRCPSRAELDRAGRLVDVRDLGLDGGRRHARLGQAGAGVDLGGIGKGYAVDVAVEALRSRGIQRGIVNAGGDLRVLGPGPADGLWRIGLRHPLRPAALLLTLRVGEESVATSGNYFRSFTVAGRQYGHVLDPRTGAPAESALSATVVAPHAMRADGLATAALVSGVDGALALVSAAGVEAIIVAGWKGRPGRVVASVTSGLRGRVDLLDPTAAIDG
jgi:FAD:protein FMN transferase